MYRNSTVQLHQENSFKELTSAVPYSETHDKKYVILFDIS